MVERVADSVCYLTKQIYYSDKEKVGCLDEKGKRERVARMDGCSVISFTDTGHPSLHHSHLKLLKDAFRFGSIIYEI